MFGKLTAVLKSGIDPKWIVVLAWLVGVQKGIGQGAISLTNMVPDSWIPHIIAWNNGLAWLGVGLMGLLGALSSNAAGPLISNPPLPSIDTTKTVARILIAAFVLSFLFAASPAMAETRRPAQPGGPVLTGDLIQDAKNDFKGDPNAPGAIQLTGNLKKDAQAIWDKIVAASDKDLSYASQLAANANTPSSLVRKQCWDAILATNQQANGLNLKDSSGNVVATPDPKLFTQIEQAAEVLDALSPQGKLFTSCAGAAQLAQTGVLQFISAALTGVAGIAKLTPISGL